MRCRLRCLAPIITALLVLAALEGTALGQSAIDPPKLPGDQPQVPLLKLARDQAFKHGEATAVEGTVDGEGLKFAVGGLSILQPVIVNLFAHNAADDLKLTLFKKEWNEPLRTGSTGRAGSVDFTFRTEGGVNILVQSPGPMRPFSLVVWAGDEIHPPMKDVVVTPAQFRRQQQSGAASSSGAGSVEEAGGGAAVGGGSAAGGGSVPAGGSAASGGSAGGGSSNAGWIVAGVLGLLLAGAVVLLIYRSKGKSHA